jgi:hypothetical protein
VKVNLQPGFVILDAIPTVVYCPLVEPRMVGDAQVPLLRIVPVEGRDGEMITRVFDPIQDCPLLQRRFQTVEIYIRDDTGSIVPSSATQSETYSPSREYSLSES